MHWYIISARGHELSGRVCAHAYNRRFDFPCDVTRMRKFYYYSVDHTGGGGGGGQFVDVMYCVLWGNHDCGVHFRV